MKKIFKNPLLTFIVGLIISGTIVYAGTMYARDITFDNSKSQLKDSNNQNVDNIQDAIDALYTKANSSSGGSSISNLINSFSINNISSSGTTISIGINGTISTTDNSEIIGYIVMADNIAKKVTSEMPCNVTLEGNREYTITVKAIDKNGDYKESSNSISFTTPSYITEPLEYPMLTTSGWVNVKYVNSDNANEFTYGLDLNINCTAANALDKNAYDGDETTYADYSSGKIYFKTGSNLQIYYMGLKLSSNPSVTIWKPENIGSTVNLGDCTNVNGYYYNRWVDSSNKDYAGKTSWILQNVYEIIYNK